MLATSDPAAACQIRLKPGGSLQTIGFCDSKAKTNRSIRYPGKELIFLCLSSEVDDGRHSNTISTTETPHNAGISLSASAVFDMRCVMPYNTAELICENQCVPGVPFLKRDISRERNIG